MIDPVLGSWAVRQDLEGTTVHLSRRLPPPVS
jgi:hypothetical protein